MGDDRGRLLYEYDPPRAHPILYAGLLVFGFVFLTGSLENLLRDNRPFLYAAYAIPFLATALVTVALLPNPVQIFENGIRPARPLALRWMRPFVRWDELAAVYPSYYDVTGAFVSPFASSDGKVTQMGLGLEWPDGRTETVKFTPTRFSLTSRRSRGFREALQVVEDIYARMGCLMVPQARTYTETEKQAMLQQARAPFLPFFAIVFLFASAAPVTWLFIRAGLDPAPSIAIGLLAPLGTSLRSYAKSRERNRLLNALSKSAQFERGRRDQGGPLAAGSGPTTETGASAATPRAPAGPQAAAGGAP